MMCIRKFIETDGHQNVQCPIQYDTTINLKENACFVNFTISF